MGLSRIKWSGEKEGRLKYEDLTDHWKMMVFIQETDGVVLRWQEMMTMRDMMKNSKAIRAQPHSFQGCHLPVAGSGLGHYLERLRA